MQKKCGIEANEPCTNCGACISEITCPQGYTQENCIACGYCIISYCE